MANKLKKAVKTIAKLSFSALALYFVFQKISWPQVSELLLSVNLAYVMVGVAFLAGSKILSAYRLHRFFRCIPLNISKRYNLRLYWIGMFYNLFLPGGIGGDGYKVYLLNKKFGTSVKTLIQASLIDRISGLLSLLILAGAGLLFIENESIPTWLRLVDLVCLVISIPVFYITARILFKPFAPAVLRSMLWSFGVQGLQVLSAFAFLFSLGATGQYLEYGVLFLISSFVSILPFTLGGIGSREFTFLIGYQYLQTDESTSIALSLMFTLSTIIVAFIGLFLKEETSEKG